MHPTKSLPPCWPQQPLSRQPSPPAPPGSRDACWGGHKPGQSGALLPPGSHESSPGLSLSVLSHRHPGFARKKLLVLRAALFLEGTGCFPKPADSQGALPLSCSSARLLSSQEQTLAEGTCPVWAWLYSTDCNVPRDLGLALVLPQHREPGALCTDSAHAAQETHGPPGWFSLLLFFSFFFFTLFSLSIHCAPLPSFFTFLMRTLR